MNGSTRYDLSAIFRPARWASLLAEECAARGAEVWLITGPTALSLSHPRIHRIDVESAREMHAAALQAFRK